MRACVRACVICIQSRLYSQVLEPIITTADGIRQHRHHKNGGTVGTRLW